MLHMVKYRLQTWADNTRLQPDADLITVATDRSLDEGDGVLRTIFTGPSLMSSGTEYFVQVDGVEEAEAILAALEVAADGGGDEDVAFRIANFARRIRRAEAYRASESDEVEQEVGTP